MKKAGDQLSLDLRHRPAMSREDFLVSPSNADAVAWIDRWPDWPGPALVLVGPAGSGKSHLGQVWRKRSGAAMVENDGTHAPEVIAEGGCFLVDDIDARSQDDDYFHLYNAVKASSGHVLFSARTAPARWTGRLPDLVSRLAAAPTVRIHAPDERLITAVIVKMFADRQLDVGAEVLSYLLSRMERSFEEARDLVAEIDRESLAKRRGVTLPLAREVIERRLAIRKDSGTGLDQLDP